MELTALQTFIVEIYFFFIFYKAEYMIINDLCLEIILILQIAMKY